MNQLCIPWPRCKGTLPSKLGKIAALPWGAVNMPCAAGVKWCWDGWQKSSEAVRVGLTDRLRAEREVSGQELRISMTTGAAAGRAEVPGASPEESGRKPEAVWDRRGTRCGQAEHAHWPQPATGLRENIVSRGKLAPAYARVVGDTGARRRWRRAGPGFHHQLPLVAALTVKKSKSAVYCP